MPIFSSTTKTRSRQSRSRRLLLVGVLTAGAFIALLLFHNGLGGVAATIGTPVHAVSAWFNTTAHPLPSYFRSKAALIAERDALTEELAERRADNAIRVGLREENRMLRDVLGMEHGEGVTARVVARPNQTPYDTLLIDRGADEGIVLNAPVFAAERIAIGHIAKVYAHKSLVVLFSTPGVSASAYIYGSDTFADAEGIGGGVIQVAVPQGIELTIGDPVILPAASAGIIGRIAYIETRESDPLQYGFVPSAVTLSELHLVHVGAEPLTQMTYDEAQEVIETASTTLFVEDIPSEALPATSTASTTLNE